MNKGATFRPWSLFALALAVRWTYALGVFALMGDAGLKGPDSHSMLANATSFAAAILDGSVSGWGWLGPSLVTMPLFNILLALHAMLFGAQAPLAFVLSQASRMRQRAW